jgi:hypothetical protein
MYGLLNAALKEFVVTTYGSASWQSIVDAVAPGIENFNKMAPYPDELTVGLVVKASAVSGTDVDTLLDQFGEFWVRYTDEQGYGPLFEIAGDSLPDFLLSLNALHTRVARSFPKLRPPSFQFDRLESGRLRMHYLSERQNLCPMIPGILRGLAQRFHTQILVVEDRCARRGDAHCEFIVSFPEAVCE